MKKVLLLPAAAPLALGAMALTGCSDSTEPTVLGPGQIKISMR